MAEQPCDFLDLRQLVLADERLNTVEDAVSDRVLFWSDIICVVNISDITFCESIRVMVGVFIASMLCMIVSISLDSQKMDVMAAC